MECYINKKLCKKADTEYCNINCKAYILFEAIYEGSNVPKKYQKDIALSPGDSDLDSFRKLLEYRQNIVENVEEGKNLYLFSKTTGNGKTSWATKIINEFIRKKVFSINITNLVYYVNTPDLLEELRLGYETGEYKNIMEKVKTAKLVLFDDIGAEKSNAWVRERLYTIINYRISEGLSTIYTSNLSIEELQINLGIRVGSRLRENTTIIELVGKDKRGI